MSEGIIYGNLSPSGRLATPAVGHVEELIDQRTATVVAAGRPDIVSTTPYSSAQLAAMPSGTVYRSTNGPQGAWEWAKQGGSWVPTGADTGWRDITAGTDNHLSGRLLIRRSRRTVEVLLDSLEFVNATNNQSIPRLPIGFRPDFWHRSVWVASSGAEAAQSSSWNVSSLGYLNIYGVPAENGVMGHVTLTTSEAYPATLPGTAV